jgi:catechol 2,3-dioxygenase-like lactoylglutathione lyase family enzyme
MSDSTSFVTGVDFVMVPVREFDAACEFYGETLGLPVLKRWGDMDGMEYQAGNLTLAITRSEAFNIEFRSHKVPIAFQVDDVEAARAELESRGVAFEADTIDSGVCHMAYFSDPDGNALMLHHRYAPKDARPGQ